jgi:hypothetical protein
VKKTKFQEGIAKKSKYQTYTTVERERKSERRHESGDIHQIHAKSEYLRILGSRFNPKDVEGQKPRTHCTERTARLYRQDCKMHKARGNQTKDQTDTDLPLDLAVEAPRSQRWRKREKQGKR